VAFSKHLEYSSFNKVPLKVQGMIPISVHYFTTMPVKFYWKLYQCRSVKEYIPDSISHQTTVLIKRKHGKTFQHQEI